MERKSAKGDNEKWTDGRDIHKLMLALEGEHESYANNFRHMDTFLLVLPYQCCKRCRRRQDPTRRR